MPKTTVSKLTTGAAATAMLSALFLTAAAPAAHAQNFGGVLGSGAQHGR